MPEIDHEVREFVEWVLCEAAEAEKRLQALKHTLHTLAVVHDITLDLDKWEIVEDH